MSPLRRPSPEHRTLAAAVAAATVLGSLFTAQAWVTAGGGDASDLGRMFLVQSAPWWAWALLAPAIFGLLDRWCPLGASAPRVVGVHVGLGVVASVVQAVGTALALRAAGVAWLAISIADVVRSSLVLRFISNMVIFSLIASLFHVRRHIEALRASRERIRWVEGRRAEGVRRLAAAVSHDLSNRMTAVLGQWAFLRHELGDLPEEAVGPAQELDEALALMHDVLRHVSTIGMDGHPLPLRLESASRVVDAVVDALATGLDARTVVGPLPAGLDDLHVAADLDRLREIAAVLATFLCESAPSPRLLVDARLVDGPGAETSPGRGPSHRQDFLEITLIGPAGEAVGETAMEPGVLTSRGTVRSTLPLTAARATIMRMAGELYPAEGRGAGFRLVLPLTREEPTTGG